MGTIVWWQRAGVKAIGLTMLAACGSRGHVPDFPPVDAAQRTATMEAVNKLRDAFNGAGACESMYGFPS